MLGGGGGAWGRRGRLEVEFCFDKADKTEKLKNTVMCYVFDGSGIEYLKIRIPFIQG